MTRRVLLIYKSDANMDGHFTCRLELNLILFLCIFAGAVNDEFWSNPCMPCWQCSVSI